jgi:hypothetical protein
MPTRIKLLLGRPQRHPDYHSTPITATGRHHPELCRETLGSVVFSLDTTGRPQGGRRLPRQRRPGDRRRWAARAPGLSPTGQLLSLDGAGLALDPAQWKTTWVKGGVLTLAYLATTRTGQSYVITVLAENPSQPINQNAALPVMLSAIRGAFTLAARR